MSAVLLNTMLGGSSSGTEKTNHVMCIKLLFHFYYWQHRTIQALLIRTWWLIITTK
jgi:hypothetical protein